MHGVKKRVFSTIDQQQAKQNERKQKLIVFISARDRVVSKIRDGIYDEEGLQLSAGILGQNPDNYTLWNYRRRALIAFSEAGDADAMEKWYLGELELTKECLMNANPKSYGAWYQRAWVLVRMRDPPLKNELALCSKALKEDERNFHCWDHRRFVCGLAHETPEQELTFSEGKVYDNFSNYSTWHYRSTLLPLVYPKIMRANGESEGPGGEHVLRRELDELVHNAFFTEPADQSAWFYLDWLLGHFCEAGAVTPQPHVLHAAVHQDRLVLSFDRPVRLTRGSAELTVGATKAHVAGSDWRAATHLSNSCTVWSLAHPLLVGASLSAVDLVLLLPDECSVKMSERKWTDACPQLSVTSKAQVIQDVLEGELHMCEEVLAADAAISLGEGSIHGFDAMTKKWPLFTRVKLWRMLDSCKYESVIVDSLNQLSGQFDTKRRAYYADLKSEILMENMLKSARLNASTAELDLSRMPLTRLSFTEFMIGIRKLNVSGCNLRSLASLGFLLLLEHLEATRNPIISLEGIETLEFLRVVHVEACAIAAADAVLKPCDTLCLASMRLAGNPLTDESKAAIKNGLRCDVAF